VNILNIEVQPFYEMAYISSGRRGTVRHCRLPFYKVYVDALPDGVSAIAVTSDMQGREGGKKNRLLGEVVSEELRLLADVGDIPHMNGVLLAGDLYDYPDCHKLGGSGDVTDVWNAFGKDFEHVIGVHGNHDMVDDALLSDSVTVLDGNAVDAMGLTIAGVSGIIGSVNRNQRKTEEDFMKMLHSVLAKKTDMILLHQGPDDPETGRIGEPLVREALEHKGSGIVIFGHCQWEDPYVEIGEHQVLNVDGRVMLFVAKDS